MESRASVQKDGSSVQADEKNSCEQSLSPTLDQRGQFLCMGEESAAALDTGAAASLVRFRLLGHRELRLGFPACRQSRHVRDLNLGAVALLRALQLELRVVGGGSRPLRKRLTS